MAADQRVVGHAIRRRQGNAMSHLGMAHAEVNSGPWHPPTGGLAQAESIAASEEGIVQGGSMAGGKTSYKQNVPMPGGKPPLASDNAAFASAVGAAREAEPNPPRPSMGEGEARGARLTVSPSMKTPVESPVPIQGGGYPVPSISSRSQSFAAGQQETYRG